MAMERQDYPAMLPQLQPPQAVEILNSRVQQVSRLNVQIADWLQERKKLEEQYSSGLRRLARQNLDAGDLGVFSVPWSTITGSADTLADSHSALAVKIAEDVEQPLRNFASTSREMSQVSTVQGNLAALAKDVERAQEKVEKQASKGEKADSGKMASASSEMDAAQTQWESQAPYVFEHLQKLDEARLTHLRDVLTQFQTHEVDQVERSRITAEQCLNVILNVETADEITTFALKAPQMRPTLTRPKRNSIATPSRSLGIPTSGSSSALAPTPSIAEDEPVGSLPEDKQKGRLKGLRRLGTVMGRSSKRESKLPAGLPTTSESPERKSRPSPFSTFSRSARSKENTSTLGSFSEAPPQHSQQRPRSPLRLGSDLFDSPSESRAAPEFLGRPSQSADSPAVNGTTVAAVAGGAAIAGGAATAAALNIPNGSHQNDLADIEPPKPAAVESAAPPPRTSSTAPQQDSEGFSVPPQELDPISQAEQDAAMGAGAPQYNVNIRDTPIQEDGGVADSSLASVAGKLQAPPTSVARRAGTVRGRRDNRNSAIPPTFSPPDESIAESSPEPAAPATREVAEPAPLDTAVAVAPAVQPPTTSPSATNSQYSTPNFGQVAASTFSPFSPQASQPMPSPLRPESRTATGMDLGRTDTQSIRSATTTGSQGGHKHPDLTSPGLNSSIIETVNARFENGKLVSSSIIGDIALAYNPADFSSPFGTEKIRLERFSSLEKVAPNPAFITPSQTTEGEYTVNLASIGKTQVAFKYQVRSDSATSNSHAPLLVTPAFKPESNQFSVIIQYSLNPSFAPNTNDTTTTSNNSITLHNVTLAFTLEGSRATSCLTKPSGTFVREKNLIYWQLHDVTLTAGEAPKKLLARFATDAAASGGSAEARWEVSGEDAGFVGSGLGVSVAGAAGGAGDPFADEDGKEAGWRAVEGSRRVVAGSYGGK